MNENSRLLASAQPMNENARLLALAQPIKERAGSLGARLQDPIQPNLFDYVDEGQKDLSFLSSFAWNSHWKVSMIGEDSRKGGMTSTNFCGTGEEEEAKGEDLSWLSSIRWGKGSCKVG